MFKLFHGDCVEIMKNFPEARVDMIFADPPYRLSNNGWTCQSGKWVSVNKGDWDRSEGLTKDYEFHLSWLRECQRMLKNDGTLWVTGTYHAIYSIGFALQFLGFRILNDICWFKPNASPNLSKRYFTASHETLIWAAKSDKSRHYFDYDAMTSDNMGKQMRSMWPIPSTPTREKRMGKHPTQKPLTLLQRVVKAGSKPGDIILDPFCGSGTTGVAAVEQSRKFIGIDISREYLLLTKKRIEAISQNNDRVMESIGFYIA